VEAVTNIVVGYGLAVLTQIVVFPLFGLHASLSENLLIGALFTITSLTRGYAIRRLFNAAWMARQTKPTHETLTRPAGI
jgi:hypothetical protein